MKSEVKNAKRDRYWPLVVGDEGFLKKTPTTTKKNL